MKKVISVVLAILLIVNNALAYTRTVKALGIGMVITTKEGTEVTLTPTAEEIKGWEVESGNVEITNNQFTMPGEDVTIKAIEEETYIFKLIFPYFTKQEDRKAGEVISVEALTENGEYVFKDWTVEGITITEEQKTNPIIEFTMPANAVTITANYGEAEGLYKITTESIEGGNITATPSSAFEGKTITITALPDTGYEYQGATISYNTSTNETTPYKKELEYIQSTGTQYINTGIIPNQDTRIVMDVEPTATSMDAVLFYGARKSGTSFWGGKGAGSSYNMYVAYGTSSTNFTRTLEQYNTRMIVDQNKNVFTDGLDTHTLTSATFQMDIPLYLFGINDPDYSTEARLLCETKLYSTKIYDNGTLVRDYIPVLDNNGVACLYDKVNEQFYYNQGSGEFTYVETDDTQRINLASNVMTFTMPASDVTITPIWGLKTYTVTFNANNESGSTMTQNFTHNVAQNLISNTFTRSGYKFTGWATSENGNVEYTDKQSYTATSDAILYAIWEEFSWNAPKLGTGLTPVNWNGSSWVTTTEDNWEYNYEIATANHGTVAGDGTGKWANAKTSDGSMFVWIPRYTYKITSGYHSSGNSWSNTTSPGTNKIEIKFSSGTTDDTTDSYLKHPAFTFGTDELEGIWVAKYESSRSNATSSSAGSGTTASSRPGVTKWTGISVSNAYTYAYNFNRTLDSHLMRNSEWGAVAYLTNAIGKIPYINNSVLITGNGGGSQDAAGASGVTNAWNTAQGVKASSTHNIYGIYDLSGGGREYVSAYDSSNMSYSNYSSTDTAATLYSNRETKYVEVYSSAYSSSKTGDAVYETSSGSGGNNSYDSDTSGAPYSSSCVFARGGIWYGEANSGIFCFEFFDGGVISTADADVAFRLVLAIP